MAESRSVKVNSHETLYCHYAILSAVILLVAIVIYNALPFFSDSATLAMDISRTTTENASSSSCLRDSREYQEFIVNLLMKSPSSRNASDSLAHQSQHWTSQMLDATGKWQSGVLQGNINWMGSFSQCLRIEDLESGVAGQYCTMTATVRMDNGWFASRMYGRRHSGNTKEMLKIQLGVCWPASCSEKDIEEHITHLMQMLNVADDVQMSINPDSCYTDKPLPYDWLTKTIILVFSVLAALVIGATSYDYLLCEDSQLSGSSSWPPASKKIAHDPAAVTPLDEMDSKDERHGTFTGNIVYKLTSSETKIEHAHQNVLRDILMVFSARRNASYILSTKSNKEHFLFLDGLRCLCTAGVLLAHFSYIFIGKGWIQIHRQNEAEMKDIVNSPIMALILNFSLAVDTFFLLGGFLTAFNFLGQIEKSGGKFCVTKCLSMYLHRYCRLTPLHLLFVAIYAGLLPHMGTGPYWRMHEAYMTSNCRNNWWKNALYIHNLDDCEQMCIDLSWFLGADIQFNLFSIPFILYPLVKKPMLGFLIVGVLFSSTVLSASLTSYVYNLPSFYEEDFNGNRLQAPSYVNHIHIKPWCRFAPYLMGISLAYVLHRKQMKVKLHPVFVIIGWISALTLGYVITFGMRDFIMGEKFMTSIQRSIFAGVRSVVWSLVVTWIVFACSTGYGGILNRALSWRLMVPLSRLTYGVYLTHVIILAVFARSQKMLFHIDAYLLVVAFVGILILSLFVSFVATLAVDVPFMQLEKLLRLNLSKRHASRS